MGPRAILAQASVSRGPATQISPADVSSRPPLPSRHGIKAFRILPRILGIRLFQWESFGNAAAPQCHGGGPRPGPEPPKSAQPMQNLRGLERAPCWRKQQRPTSGCSAYRGSQSLLLPSPQVFSRCPQMHPFKHGTATCASAPTHREMLRGAEYGIERLPCDHTGRNEENECRVQGLGLWDS